MTWTKLSDDFADDCYSLSSDAFRLHVEGILWSNRKLLDLRLDKEMLPRWATKPEAVPELVALGWWSDEGTHYIIRHHAAYQRTREQVLKQQAANQRNGARGGKAPRERFSTTKSVSESVSESLSERDRTGQDRTPLREVVEIPATSNGSSSVFCRYCDNELRAHMSSQCLRGYCHRAACQAAAKAELS